jgi:circadian clock protein KaiC
MSRGGNEKDAPMANHVPEETPRPANAAGAIVKVPTGIAGFDEICMGGLPRGRVVAIIGSPGAGKTVFAMETLVNRVRLLDEGGIFVSFEEPLERLRENAAAFQWNFTELDGTRIILVDGRLAPDTLLNGDFQLTGLLAQAGALAAQIGTRNIVLDGIDMLLSGLPDLPHERRELRRIDQWVLDNNLSCIVTGKSAAGDARERARLDYLHYLTDLVVELNGTLTESTFNRTLRIIKYRGSNFVANAFPVVITDNGLQVVAKTKTRLGAAVFEDRLSSGIPALDALLEGGFRRGRAMLVSGAPGTAKTSMAGHFTNAACAAGERVLFVSFDESHLQIIGDLRTIGIDLEPHMAAGRLAMLSLRAASRSPEDHFVEVRHQLEKHHPSCLVLDPISVLLKSQSLFASEIAEFLLDEARARGTTNFCTSLSGLSVNDQEVSISNLSTLADTWIHLTYSSRGGERNRAMTIVKSRGTAHSNQVRELIVGPAGLDLVHIYSGEGDVLMGSARAQRELADRRRELERALEEARQEFELSQSLTKIELQFAVAEADLNWKRKELELTKAAANARKQTAEAAAAERLRSRGVVEE